MNRIQQDLIIKAITEGFDKVASEWKKVEKAQKEATETTGLTKFNDKLKNVAAGVTAAVIAFGGLGKVVRTVIDAIREGAAFDRANTALLGFTGSAEAAAEALEAVQEAGGGALSMMSSAQNAARLFSMGLASTADEAAKLTKIAITLGASMGKGPQEAFEEFTLLLANQSILRLDTYGISAGRVRARMAELRADTAGMGREQQFLTATMEIAEEKMLALESAGFEASSTIDILDAEIQNARTSFAQWIADGWVPLLRYSRELVIALGDVRERILRTNEAMGSEAKLVPVLVAGLRAFKDADIGKEGAKGLEQAVESMRTPFAEIQQQSAEAAAAIKKIFNFPSPDAVGQRLQNIFDAMGVEIDAFQNKYPPNSITGFMPTLGGGGLTGTGGGPGGGAPSNPFVQGSSSRSGVGVVGGQASGGRERRDQITMYGEQGPEMRINGVIVPASLTRMLRQLGLQPDRQMAIGKIDPDVVPVGPLQPTSAELIQSQSSGGGGGGDDFNLRQLKESGGGGGGTQVNAAVAKAAAAAAQGVAQTSGQQAQAISMQQTQAIVRQNAETDRKMIEQLQELNKELKRTPLKTATKVAQEMAQVS